MTMEAIQARSETGAIVDHVDRLLTHADALQEALCEMLGAVRDHFEAIGGCPDTRINAAMEKAEAAAMGRRL